MDLIKNTYEKIIAAALFTVSIIGLALGISRLSRDSHIGITRGADGPTAIFVTGKKTLQSVLKNIASVAILIASAAIVLLSFVKRISGKEL